MKKSNNKKGFTLVELVIVVAVIAILSAILIPTIGTVISDAKKAGFKSDVQTYITSTISDTKDDIPAQYVLKIEEKVENNSTNYTIVAVYEIKGSNCNFEEINTEVSLKMGDLTSNTKVKVDGTITLDTAVKFGEDTTEYKWTKYGENGLYVLIAQ